MRGISGESSDIDSAASRWAIRVAEGPLGADQQRELDAWLQGDPARLGAFVRAQAAWADVDRIIALDAGARVLQSVTRVERRPWIPFATAASLALLVLAGLFGYSRFAGRVATGRGEVLQMALADGSMLTLNSDSVVQVRYEKTFRRIVLRRGAAFFQVVHNPKRPFVVEAGDVSVTDIGTAFAVDRDGNHVAVTVSHGSVRVDDRSDRGDKQRYIRRDEQFVAAPTGSRKVALTSNEVSQQLAWRKGLLVFEGRPLGLAADEVSRYSSVPVVIDDPILARAEFVGVFHMGDSRGFANAAARAFNGQVSLSDGTLHVSRQENSPSH